MATFIGGNKIAIGIYNYYFGIDGNIAKGINRQVIAALSDEIPAGRDTYLQTNLLNDYCRAVPAIKNLQPEADLSETPDGLISISDLPVGNYDKSLQSQR